jgi:hypothetical protein
VSYADRVPYADPEKRRAIKRESARQRRERQRPGADGRVLSDPPGEEELLRILGELARGGSVAAARLLLERLDRRGAPEQDEGAGSVIADLARRRAARAAGR